MAITPFIHTWRRDNVVGVKEEVRGTLPKGHPWLALTCCVTTTGQEAGISRGGPQIRISRESREQLEVRGRHCPPSMSVSMSRGLLPCLLVSPEACPPAPSSETMPLAVTPMGRPAERTKKLISKGALVSGWPRLVGG